MALKNHKHFRVISPAPSNPKIGEWTTASTTSSSPPMTGGTTKSSLDEGENEEYVDVQKMRAQIETERAKATRFEREWNRVARELEEEREAARRHAETTENERRRLEAKLAEESSRYRDLEMRKSTHGTPAMEKRLELAEERCRYLERALQNAAQRNPIGDRFALEFMQRSVLFSARGDVDQLRQLLATAADPRTVASTPEKDGTTPAHAASSFGNSGCLAVLLEHGANPSAVRPIDRATPLHLTASNGHYSCIDLLLQWNADADALDSHGNTSLLLSAENGHLDSVGLLLDRGAALGVSNKAGRNALHEATEGGHYQCLVRLVRAAERQAILKQLVGKMDDRGWTPIHVAANKGYDDCLSLLIGCSHASLAQQDNWGRTPLDLASTPNCKELLNGQAHKPVVIRLLGQENSTSIGVIRIQPHHQWNDFDQFVDETLITYSAYVNGGITMPATAPSDLHPRMPSITIEGSGLRGNLKTFHHNSPQLGEQKLNRETDSGHQTGSGSSSSGSWDDGGDGLGLSGDSVAFYECGNLRWVPGSLPMMSSGQKSAGGRLLGTPPPYLVFGGTLLEQEGCGVGLDVNVHLKDSSAGGRLDAVVNDYLISASQLRSYTELLESTRAVILCGPPGTEKSRLARLLGESLKVTLKDEQEAEVTHVVLSPTFTRADLLYVLHSKGFFVPAESASRSQNRPSVLILDDLHRIPLSEVMAELLTALNYRGPLNAFWLSALNQPTHSGQAAPHYKEGRYYLKKNAYFIGTMDKQGASNMDVSIHHCFRWIMCQFDVEPIQGLLRRELRRRLLNVYDGRLPAPNDLLFCLIEWLWKTWRRLNVCAVRLQLPELSLGPRLFFSCPLIKDNPKAIVRWFSELWNFGVVPCVQDVVLRMNGSAMAPDLSADQAATPVLITLICKAVVPGCPLSEQDLKYFIEGLQGYSEGHQLLHEMRIKSVGEKTDRRASKQHATQKTSSPQRQRKVQESPSPRILRRVATAPTDSVPPALENGDTTPPKAGVATPLRSTGSPTKRRPETRTMYVERPSTVAFEAEMDSADADSADADRVNVTPPATSDNPVEEGKVRRSGGSRAGDFARRLFGRLRGRTRPKGTPKLLRKEATAADQARLESRSSTASPSVVKSRSVGLIVSTTTGVSRSASTGPSVVMGTGAASMTESPINNRRKSNSMPPERENGTTESYFDSHPARTSSSRVDPTATHYRTRSHSDASSRNQMAKRAPAENSDSDNDRRREISPPGLPATSHDGRRKNNAVVTVADVHVEASDDRRAALSRRRAQSFTPGSAAAAANGAQQKRRVKPTSDTPHRRTGPRLASQV